MPDNKMLKAAAAAQYAMAAARVAAAAMGFHMVGGGKGRRSCDGIPYGRR